MGSNCVCIVASPLVALAISVAVVSIRGIDRPSGIIP